MLPGVKAVPITATEGRPLSSQKAVTSVTSVGRRHHEILTYVLANPHKPITEIAQALGYTTVWVQRVVRSDMFQLELRQHQEAHRARVVGAMEERLYSVTHRMLEDMDRRFKGGQASEKFVLGAAPTLLGAIGYGSQHRGEEPQRHLHVHVNGDQLARARELQRTSYEASDVPSKPAADEAQTGPVPALEAPAADANCAEENSWEVV
jgi:hypothetical protein